MEGRRRACALAAALVICGLPFQSKGQSVTPGELGNAARQGELLQRQQQQLQEERQRQRDRATEAPAGEALPKAPVEANAAPSEGKCIDTRSLDLVGAHLLSKKQVARLEHSVAGHCLGVKELNALLRRITDMYVSRGYVTTRAYIPPQNAGEGRLSIVVIEGKIEKIEVQPRGSISTTTAFPGMVGEVFNLRDAEQGIDQLNRLSSNSATLDIRPGSTPGSSILVVTDSPTRRVTGSLAADDTGTPATGLWQGTATVLADDLLRINDGLIVSHTRSDPAGPAMSRLTSVNYSVPYGWWTGSVSYVDSAYASVVQGVTQNFVTSGTERDGTLRIDRVAYRNQNSKLTFHTDITRRDSENFVAGQLIGTSSRVLTLLDLDANLSKVWGSALWSFDAGLSRGVSWLGSNAPHSEFLKETAGVAVSRGFTPFGVKTQVSSTFSGQWSNDVLYPSEQIAIAGPFAVRGYRDTRLFGDRGYTWRNEVGFPFAIGAGTHSVVSLRPFAGWDLGRVESHDNLPGAYLSGWSTGLSLGYAPITVQVSWSWAGSRSANIPSDHFFFARLAANF